MEIIGITIGTNNEMNKIGIIIRTNNGMNNEMNKVKGSSYNFQAKMTVFPTQFPSQFPNKKQEHFVSYCSIHISS